MTQQSSFAIEEAAQAMVERMQPDPALCRALLHALVSRLAETEEWLTPGEFAKVTGAHLNSVTNWARAGRIRHTTYPSGRIRGIHVSEVEGMMRTTPEVPEESLRATPSPSARIGGTRSRPSPVRR